VAEPFYITFDRKKQKRWMLVIRCATIGAVHIEMLKRMTTASFLPALERFLAIRPRPSVFLADKGSNFHSGWTVLKEKQQINVNEAEAKYNIKFCFAPLRAPHFMGLVERIVGASKAALRPALNTAALSSEEMRTIFAKQWEF
jgi:hypothetical protein